MSDLTDMLAWEANEVYFDTCAGFALSINYTPAGSQTTVQIVGVPHVAETGQITQQPDGFFSIYRGTLTLQQTDGNFGTGDTFNFAMPTSNQFANVNWKYEGTTTTRLDNTCDVPIVCEVPIERGNANARIIR